MRKHVKTQILALDIAGNPFRWLTLEEAATYVAAERVAWSLGDTAQVLHGGWRRDGARSELSLPAVIALARSTALVAHLQGASPHVDNSILFRRDRGVCAYCGEAFSPRELTRDHVFPRARGGVDNWNNVVSACQPCNVRKACRTPEEAGMALLYVPYAPCRAEHFILTGRRILADQMDYLLARLPRHSRLWGENGGLPD